MKRILLLFILLISFSGMTQTTQSPEENHAYVVAYIETVDVDRVDAFKKEMLSYSNKVVSCDYNWSSHEMTVVYTPLMRDDTIFQIILQYFGNMKKVRGTYITETY